jgi:hypothetical protein
MNEPLVPWELPRNRYTHIGYVFSLSEIYTFIGKEKHVFSKYICSYKCTLYFDRGQVHNILGCSDDWRMKNKIFLLRPIFLYIVCILFSANFVISQPLYTITLCAILVYVQMYRIIYLIKYSVLSCFVSRSVFYSCGWLLYEILYIFNWPSHLAEKNYYFVAYIQ